MRIVVFYREAIGGFCPVRSTGQKNLKSARVCVSLRLLKIRICLQMIKKTDNRLENMDTK